MKGNELKPHIGIFGRRNYGKSSLINYLTNQPIAIVSDIPGTTTDPVRKTMEISGIGPVVWVDTAGIDDQGTLGSLRTSRTDDTLPQMDLAIILITNNTFDTIEQKLITRCRQNNIPILILYSQIDRYTPNPDFLSNLENTLSLKIFPFTIHDPGYRSQILSLIQQTLPPTSYQHPTLLGDVISPNDIILLVTPIDSSAPQGRLILPQVQLIRDILDNNAIAQVCQEDQLPQALASLQKPPRLVVTDSQVFHKVAPLIPQSIYLTSFSVVLARSKGLFQHYLQGTPHVDRLHNGDRILLLESCTHNVTCEDIGRVKLPKLITQHTGLQLQFEVLAGDAQPQCPITQYAMVIQCGGCVATPKTLAARISPAIQAHIPVSNYGLMLAHLNGILQRSIQIFNNI